LEPETETSSRSRNFLWLLAPLGILAFWAWRSKSIIRSNEQIKSIGQNNNSGEEGAPKEAAVIPQSVPSPLSYSEPKYRPDKTPWWKTMVEFAAVLIALGLLIVNYQQQQSTERAAYAAKDSIDLARKNAHFEQRAWLAISYGKGPYHFTVGQPFAFPVQIVDTGKTPAKGVQGEMVTLFLNRTDRLRFNYDHGSSVEIGTMLPNESHDAPSWLIATKVAPREKIVALPMSKQMVDAIRSGDGYVVVYGHLSYRSVFGIEHWIHFCGLINPMQVIISQKECTEYNDVDDNEEK